MLSIGTMIIPLGQREMRDLNTFIHEHPQTELYYDNLDPSIWSEWGLLQLSVHKTITGIHKETKLKEILKPGNAVLINTSEGLERVKKAWEEHPGADAQASGRRHHRARRPALLVGAFGAWIRRTSARGPGEPESRPHGGRRQHHHPTAGQEPLLDP